MTLAGGSGRFTPLHVGGVSQAPLPAQSWQQANHTYMSLGLDHPMGMVPHQIVTFQPSIYTVRKTHDAWKLPG